MELLGCSDSCIISTNANKSRKSNSTFKRSDSCAELNFQVHHSRQSWGAICQCMESLQVTHVLSLATREAIFGNPKQMSKGSRRAQLFSMFFVILLYKQYLSILNKLTGREFPCWQNSSRQYLCNSLGGRKACRKLPTTLLSPLEEFFEFLSYFPCLMPYKICYLKFLPTALSNPVYSSGLPIIT